MRTASRPADRPTVTGSRASGRNYRNGVNSDMFIETYYQEDSGANPGRHNDVGSAPVVSPPGLTKALRIAIGKAAIRRGEFSLSAQLRSSREASNRCLCCPCRELTRTLERRGYLRILRELM